jgi:CheY-like chemotaxis protein
MLRSSDLPVTHNPYIPEAEVLMDPEAEQRRSEKYVLIVEDEPDNREIMKTVVEDLLEFRALLASDGEEAIELASRLQPVVVLMDLMMPVLDGFEAITRLKSNKRTAHIPVVAVTALGRPADRQRAIEAGADDYLSKPFDLDILAETLGRYADREKVTSEEQGR